MDPATLMALLSGSQAGGAGAAPPPGGADTLGNINPMGGMTQGLGSLGTMLKGIQAPQAAEPKFSGGVNGSQLPFKPQITDMLTPAMNAAQTHSQHALPTLGALLAMAPGGGA